MATIEEQLTYLNQTKGLIKQAIINKGGSISDDDTFRSYADKINNLNIGSGGGYTDDEIIYMIATGTSPSKTMTSLNRSDITSIADYAFVYSENLKSINLPNCTYIGKSAFENVPINKLVSINLPKVTTIHTNAFRSSSSSTSSPAVTLIAPMVENIASDAFAGRNIEVIDLPNLKSLSPTIDNVTYNSSTTFSNNKKLRKIWIPSTCSKISATSYYGSPFNGCFSTAVIYTDAASKLSGWGAYWNYYSSSGQLSVVWSATHEEFENA